MRWKTTAALILGLLMTWAATPAAFGQAAADKVLLRFVCDDDNVGAVVSINGVEKAECPFDILAPAGTLTIRAVKPVGELREQVFEQEFRAAGGVAKKVEIILSAPRLTARGRALEEARVRAEAEREQTRRAQLREQQRVAAAARERLAAERAKVETNQRVTQARAKTDAVVDGLLLARRAKQGTADAPCPDCPKAALRLSASGEFPTSADPETQGLLDKARQELLQLTKSSGASFRPPEAAASLPCASADLAMRDLASLVQADEMSPKVRASKQTPPGAPEPYVRDVKLWPVQANCVDGLLDGPLEFWAFGNLVSAPSYTLVTPQLWRVRATMAKGKPIGLIEQAMVGTAMTAGLDMPAGFGDSVYFQYRYAAGSGNLRSVEVSLQKMSGVAPLSVLIGRAFNATTAEITSYEGGKPTVRRFMRDGLLHGEFRIFGSPDNVSCYRDGISIQMTPCVVDQAASAPGYLGVAIQDFTPDMAEAQGVSGQLGALVAAVVSGGPGQASGLASGDVVIAVNGQSVATASGLTAAVGPVAPGGALNLDVLRQGKVQSLKAISGSRPAQTAAAPTQPPPFVARAGNLTVIGLTLSMLDDTTLSRLGPTAPPAGAVVEAVAATSDAAQAGLLPGDVIIRVGDNPVLICEDVVQAVDAARNAGRARVLVAVRRAGNVTFTPLKI